MRTASQDNPISIAELCQLAKSRFGDMVKAVVDLERGIMLLDADLHADQEAELLAQGSASRISGGSTCTRTWPKPTGWRSTP
jgi:hypothetical protein